MASPVFVGPEFQVNATSVASQGWPSLTALADGGYFIVWESYNQDGSALGIFGQRYDANGNTNGGEIQVNTYTFGNQQLPVVAGLDDGGFVVTWMSYFGDDTDAYGVYAQRYDANGGLVGGQFQVNTEMASWQLEPSITALNDGGFVITWESSGQDGADYGAFGQRYDADGGLVGVEFQINTYTAGTQKSTSVTALDDGGFVVVWESQDAGGGDSYGVYGQRYDVDGAPVGGEFKINTFTPANFYTLQFDPEVVSLEDGGFMVTWSTEDGAGFGIFAQRFFADGTVNGGEFQVNTYSANDQRNVDVTGLPDGGFLITWASVMQDGDWNGVIAQRFDAAGVAIGEEFIVNTTTEGQQYNPQVQVLADGSYVVVWRSDGQDGDSGGIFAQTFGAQLFGTNGVDNMSDTGGADWVRGQGGDDTLYGLDGNDLMHGGAGNDTLYGGEGNDRLKGNIGDDTLYGGNGNDFLKGQAGNDTLVGGAGKDTLRGGTGSDTFVFNLASDSTMTQNDRIMDFEVGIDQINLSAVASFSFIGGDQFSGTEAEIRAIEVNGNTILRIDVDGDGVADMKIFMAGSLALTVDDFIL